MNAALKAVKNFFTNYVKSLNTIATNVFEMKAFMFKTNTNYFEKTNYS